MKMSTFRPLLNGDSHFLISASQFRIVLFGQMMRMRCVPSCGYWMTLCIRAITCSVLPKPMQCANMQPLLLSIRLAAVASPKQQPNKNFKPSIWWDLRCFASFEWTTNFSCVLVFVPRINTLLSSSSFSSSSFVFWLWFGVMNGDIAVLNISSSSSQTLGFFLSQFAIFSKYTWNERRRHVTVNIT